MWSPYIKLSMAIESCVTAVSQHMVIKAQGWTTTLLLISILLRMLNRLMIYLSNILSTITALRPSLPWSLTCLELNSIHYNVLAGWWIFQEFKRLWPMIKLWLEWFPFLSISSCLSTYGINSSSSKNIWGKDSISFRFFNHGQRYTAN